MQEIPKRVEQIFNAPEIKRLHQYDRVWGSWIIAVIVLLPGTILSLILPLRGEAFLAIGLLCLLGLSLLMVRLGGKKERRIFDKKMQDLGYDAAEIERLWHARKDEETQNAD